MKSLFLIIMVISISITSLAQNWQLFPYQQRTLYEINDGKQEPFIEIVINDSISEKEKTITCLINAKQYNNPAIDEIIHQNDKVVNPSDGYPNQSIIKKVLNYYSLTKNPNSLTRINFNISSWIGYYSCPFNEQANVGDKWMIENSGLLFTCDSTSSIPVFDKTDSVKYFSLLNTYTDTLPYDLTFILSKEHGLLEFVPFEQLLESKTEKLPKIRMVGYEKDDQRVGKKLPGFFDFFHLSPGDELFYAGRSVSYSIWGVLEIEKFDSFVSVVAVNQTENGIAYTMNGEYQITPLRNFEDYTYKFTYDNYLPLFATNTGNGCFTNELPFFANSIFVDNRICPIWFIEKIMINDSATSISYISPGSMVYSSSMHLLFNETFFGFTLDTRFGLTKYWESEGKTIILNDAIIAGKIYSFDYPYASAIDVKQPQIKLFPNPFEDHITISAPEAANNQFNLFNGNGQLVKSGLITNKPIDMKELPKGIYLIQLNTGKHSIAKRIIKN